MKTLTTDKLIEYMKIYLISLNQDLEDNPESINVVDIPGQIYAVKHMLEVYDEL